jgi:soluble lytic murein transglycosylase
VYITTGAKIAWHRTSPVNPRTGSMLLTQLSLALALAAAPAQLHSVDSSTWIPVGVVTVDDSMLLDVRGALARGRPWHASRLVASLLADSGRRTPTAVFLAASAASQWGGWSEVGRLLKGEPWLDSLFGGRGQMLLSRSALEAGADSAALEQVLRVRPGGDPVEDGERLLVLAQALERLGVRDSAAASYRRVAERLPSIADWVLLRAAAVTDDSAARADLYAGVTLPLARERIPWAEAAASEAMGDLSRAAEHYRTLGARLTSLRLRLALSADSADRAELRTELLGLTGHRDAVFLLDSAFAPLSPAEDLAVARGAADAGLSGRAVAGYARAFAASLGTSQDRFDYASALARLGRHGDAAFQFNLVRTPRSLAASAAYLRARSLVRGGQRSEGRSALLEVGKRYPREAGPASTALFLLGDLAADDRSDRLARTYYRRAALRYPSSRFAAPARFRAAMVELLTGRAATSAGEFDELARRYPKSDEAPAAVYWAGRAWVAAGDTAAALARWELAAGGEPGSYYTGLAARRLGRPAWTPPPATDTFVAIPAADSAVARAAVLARLGLSAEARREFEVLARTTDTDPERLLALAAALRASGQASYGIQLARRALANGAQADARTYRLLYPVVHQDALLAEAAEQRIDPSFVAALIRQESMFNPSATSPAGARGLMQVMPDLGGRLARSLAYPVWDPVLLYQPDVSLQLGSFHLQELLGRYERPVEVLAAYNAGASRVERWSRRAGVEDPEVFAERIPFVETRGYVRVIQRNQELYRSLYSWSEEGL